MRVYSKSTLCSCLNVKELLARNRCEFERSVTATVVSYNGSHLVRKRKYNHLAKLASLA